MARPLTPAYASCPQCGGHPELDETGRPYTCYFCCDSGRVDAAVADAYLLAVSDEAERWRPRRLGAFARISDLWDDEAEEVLPLVPAPGFRLFTGIWEIECSLRAKRPAAWTRMEDDDIPF